MRQCSVLPDSRLRAFIVAYQFIEEPEATLDWKVDIFPPYLSSGFCFVEFPDEPMMVTHGAIEKEVLPAQYVLPSNTERYALHYKGGVQAVGVLFRLGKLREMFGWPQHLFTDKTVALQVLPERTEFTQLNEALRQAKGKAVKVALLDRFFLRCLERKRAPNARVCRALQYIRESHGLLSADQLSRKADLSQRHLRRLFREYLGIPPHAFIRLYRFYQAYWALQSGRYESLTRLALDHGYYDQAHFIHDFRTFTGRPHACAPECRELAKQLAWKEEAVRPS